VDAKQCYGIINTHVSQESEERKEWDQWTDWYHAEATSAGGTRSGDALFLSHNQALDAEEAIVVETNYAFAFIDTMTANVCPKNPQITVGAVLEKHKRFAKARERLANSCLRRDNAGALSVQFATNAGICGRGVTKVVWNASLNRPEASDIDPRRFFFDMTVPFHKSRYAIEVTLVTEDELKMRVKRKKSEFKYNKDVAARAQYGSYPDWFKETDGGKSISSAFRWAVVYEFWDFVGGKYFHFLDGNEEPLLEGPLPYTYVRNPFIVKTFNRSLRHHGGLSDIKLIASHQEHLNEIDSLELTHAMKSIPATVVNSSAVDSPEEFMSAITAVDRPGAYIEAKCSTNIRNPADFFAQLPTPTLIPSFATMRNVAKEGMAFTLGMADYQRGKGGGSDLATELSLMDQSLQTRNGRRVITMMSWVSELAQKYIGLYRQFLSPDGVAPVFESTTSVSEVLDIDSLGFSQGATLGEAEQEWWYMYESVAFDPAENSRLVQLRSIQQFFQFLVNNPNVDQAKLVHKLLDLLNMSELAAVVTPQAAMPQQPVQSAGGAQNQPVDRPATGGMPMSMATDPTANLPPQATADQPKVM